MPSRKAPKKKTKLSKKLRFQNTYKIPSLVIIIFSLAVVSILYILLASAAPTTSPSAQAMPVGNLNGWRQIFTEDFTTPVPEGSFPGSTYSTKWGVYPDNSPDTAANTEGARSRYYASRVVSVRDGILNKRLRTENINGVSTPLVATLTPLLPGTPSYNPAQNGGWPQINNTPTSMRYGRYSIRFRADSVEGFKTAWLLWPETENWPADGEVDFPEGDLNGRICAFMHRQNATAGSDQDAGCSNATFTTWHTATIERTPTYISFLLDGTEILRSTNRLPEKDMNWRIQTETCFPNCQPRPTATGNVQIDWVSVWAWDPNARASTTTASPTVVSNPTPTVTPTTISPSISPTNTPPTQTVAPTSTPTPATASPKATPTTCPGFLGFRKC